jgi:hypothetical protein
MYGAPQNFCPLVRGNKGLTGGGPLCSVLIDRPKEGEISECERTTRRGPLLGAEKVDAGAVLLRPPSTFRDNNLRGENPQGVAKNLVVQ